MKKEIKDVMTDKDLIIKVRQIAKKYNWAIGVHGSLKRDIDLIGIPWNEGAISWYELIIRIKDELKYKELGLVSDMPLKRKGVLLRHPKSIYIKVPKGKWKPKIIDLSLIDTRSNI